MTTPLNLFYAEPDDDRWLRYDRYPRRFIRRVVRGRPTVGGHERVFLNLCAGLDRIGVPYRANDYRHARRHPEELACLIGKHSLLDACEWKNPIVYGAAVCSHPLDDPGLFARKLVVRVLVPGPWMKRMFDPYWAPRVETWPVGIDTEQWRPASCEPSFDVLVYDKVRWDHAHYDAVLIDPLRRHLQNSGHSVREIRYGHYRERDFKAVLSSCRAMVFLCEHETQGIAYQQALSSGIPIFAWDRGGDWQDPAYYPHKVKFGPVTSVPYWDRRCGERFIDAAAFAAGWDDFWSGVLANRYQPREYVLSNLTLEQSAQKYLRIIGGLADAKAA